MTPCAANSSTGSNRSCPGEGRRIVSPCGTTSTTPSSSCPLEIAIETKDPKFLDWTAWADRQWETRPDGLSAETRFWIDDMYMLTMLQLEAYRATGDRKYLDRDAKEMAAYLDNCSNPTAFSFTHRTSPSIGDVETAGSLPAWPKC